ncbi:hypothetical protein BGY98DRAFT_925181, partial [Russula aff. rugulosa BPL654]
SITSPPTLDASDMNLIIRSSDLVNFRVRKSVLAAASPFFKDLLSLPQPSDGEIVDGLPVVQMPEDSELTLDSFADAVVQLPESGEIIHSLLTFIFHVTPLIPSTHEEAMELLSVAQKYQMEIALTHIRGSIARQNPLPTRPEPALRIYALAQKHGLRLEALQTARTILGHPMTIEDFDNKLDIMPGASLYELWKYYETVRAILASDLAEFRESGVGGTMTGLRCTELSSSQIPSWVDQYIVSLGNAPNLFDPLELNIAMTRHIKNVGNGGCECGSISSQTIHAFWDALVSVVHNCFKNVSVVDVPGYLGY